MPIYPFNNITPKIDKSAFVHQDSCVIGDVVIGSQSSIWPNVTIRGDVNYIRVGDRTNIQDNSCVHVTRVTCPTIIGDDVTIGHSVLLHGCTIHNRAFIGMRACIMDGAVIEEAAMVGAGALVTPNKIVKSGELWLGSPARYARAMTKQELQFLQTSANNYVRLGMEYQTSNVSNVNHTS
jgi:carbonic anhydrase/acetyltransferase-like protein (isoleucine patch superfamily)